ncbi:MAG: hypothetical protein NT040_01285 [Bacteroidetes bacterium]|nr:hypothetical protein [Bacteroidota bacterium]
MKTVNRLVVVFVVSVMLFAGCSKEVTKYIPSGPDMTSLAHQYKLAVMDAKAAEPWEIYRSLVAVTYYGDSSAGDGNLTWSADSAGRMRLLVVSWMTKSSTQYWPVGQPFKTSSSQSHMAWITTVPQMAGFLKKNNFTGQSSLHLRIAQLLGMPPDSQNDYFVEFWVYPVNLFRPAPDPEITDHEAGLYFPSTATLKHRDWFLNQLAGKYDTSTTSAFPWTRLGYTYDWATPLNPVGLSEFVVDTSALVTVKGIYSSWEYYQASLGAK